MAQLTTLAGLLADTHWVAAPAFLMNYDFCTERFIGNIAGIAVMAFRAGVSFRCDVFRFVVVTYRAINPG